MISTQVFADGLSGFAEQRLQLREDVQDSSQHKQEEQIREERIVDVTPKQERVRVKNTSEGKVVCEETVNPAATVGSAIFGGLIANKISGGNKIITGAGAVAGAKAGAEASKSKDCREVREGAVRTSEVRNVTYYKVRTSLGNIFYTTTRFSVGDTIQISITH